MSGLNFDALKQVQNELSTGDGVFLYQNKLTEQGVDIRILPPASSMNGLPYFKRVTYNINKKVFVSPLTFGEECPIDEEIALAEDWAAKNGDKQLKALIEKLDNPYPAKKEEYLVPILLLDVKYNADWSVASMKVVGDKPKYLICSKQLLSSIVEKFTSKHFYNGTSNGLTDREKGWNLTLTKKVKNSKTEYSCEGWREQTEMPEKYYRELADPILFTKKGMQSDEYLTAVIRNYLYGEPTIEEELRYPDLKDLKDASASEVSEDKPAAPPRAKTQKVEETAAPSRASKPAKAPAKEEAKTEEPKTPPRRNVLDDLSNL